MNHSSFIEAAFGARFFPTQSPKTFPSYLVSGFFPSTLHSYLGRCIPFVRPPPYEYKSFSSCQDNEGIGCTQLSPSLFESLLTTGMAFELHPPLIFPSMHSPVSVLQKCNSNTKKGDVQVFTLLDLSYLNLPNVTHACILLVWDIIKTQKIGDANGINWCYNRHFPKKCNSKQKCNTLTGELMEKKKTLKNKKSTTQRIPNHILTELKQIGNGDWKAGLLSTITTWKIMNKNPEIKLMHDVDILMSDLRLFYSDNHFKHFDNFPAVVRKFLKTGYPDFSIMSNKRFEKSLKEFEEDAAKDK